MFPLNNSSSQLISHRNSNNNENPEPSKLRFALGLFLFLAVDVLWVVSAELTKYIYGVLKYEKPFFVTYVKCCSLTVYLLILCFVPSNNNEQLSSKDYTQLLQETTENEDENFYSEGNNSLGDSTFVPVGAGAGETTDSDDASPRAVRFSKVAEVRVMSAAEAGEAVLARLSWPAWRRAAEAAKRQAAARAARRHAALALAASLPWFSSLWLWAICLRGMTPSTSLVMMVWPAPCLLLLVQRQNVRANIVLALILALGALGVAQWDAPHLGGAGAAAGAAYTIHMLLLTHHSPTSPFFFAGLVGAVIWLAAWPLGGVLHATSVEAFDWPTPHQWLYITLNAVLGAALPEALFIWATRLTFPFFTTGMFAFAPLLAAIVQASRGGIGEMWAAVALAVGAAVALHTAASRITRRIAGAVKGRFDRIGPPRFVDEQSEMLMSPEDSP